MITLRNVFIENKLKGSYFVPIDLIVQLPKKVSRRPAKFIRKTSNVIRKPHECLETYLQFANPKVESMKLSVYCNALQKSNEMHRLSWNMLYIIQ